MSTFGFDLVRGAGSVHFAERDGNGVYLSGRRILGETPDMTALTEAQTFDVDSADSRIKETVTWQVGVKRTARFTVRDGALENLAMFIMGGLSTVTQTATPVVDETIKIWRGAWTQIGESLANPTGVRNVGSVVLTGSSGSPTYSATTDYELDAVMGRIRGRPGGSITDGASALIDYTPAANTRKRVASDALGPRSGALWFVSDNPNGENKDYFWPYVTLIPDGELVLKSRDTVQAMSFLVSVGTLDGYAQLYIDGRPA